MSYTKILQKIIFSSVTFFGLALASCAQQDEQPRMRIVGVDGKKSSHPIITRTPELNAQILSSQGASYKAAGSRYNFPGANNSQTPPQQKLVEKQPDSNYAEIAQSTFQTVPSPQQTTPVTNVEPVAPGNNPIIPTGASDDSKQQVVQYDLSQEDSIKSAEEEQAALMAQSKEKKPITAIKSETRKPTTLSKTHKQQKGKYFVQVGSFSNQYNAKKTLDSMKKFHRGFIETVKGEKTIHRVLLGPLSDKKKASQIVAKIKGEGHEAILVK